MVALPSEAVAMSLAETETLMPGLDTSAVHTMMCSTQRIVSVVRFLTTTNVKDVLVTVVRTIH